MTYQTINPADGARLEVFDSLTDAALEDALRHSAEASSRWVQAKLEQRCAHIARVGETLRANADRLARTITLEMGKVIKEARGEIEKCAWVCDYYAEQGGKFLADEVIESDGTKSYVAYQPLGTVLAVMPWNFPFWQVFRFAAPALVGGNTGLLKHASNVPQCALAIEEVFREAGVPEGVFRTLLITTQQVAGVIADPRVHAVTLTGSGPAGSKVAGQAGAHLKKSVLELGGSDAFIVLDDADMDGAVKNAVASRFLNCGQSCIAAKRFIVMESVADDFVERFRRGAEALAAGDPMQESTTLGPMARHDLRDELHRQVAESVEKGAVVVTGGEPIAGSGAFYKPTILDHVVPGMSAYSEELFGPVASVIRVKDETQALQVANGSRFGLGGSVWTRDPARGERIARGMASGCCFVNGMVKSDPRLPFGGVKESGFGRELSYHGMREFLNAKTIWVK